MSSKTFLVFIIFVVLIGSVLAPYLRFVVQREGLDNDLGRVSLEYTMLGRAKFEKRVDGICREARLKPGSYQVKISEDKKSKVVSVEIRYAADFSIFFVPQTKNVVVRKDFESVDL